MTTNRSDIAKVLINNKLMSEICKDGEKITIDVIIVDQTNQEVTAPNL